MGLACALFLVDVPIRAQRAVHATNRVAAAVDDRYTVARPGNRHPLARAEYDAGIASPGMRMERMVLVLAPDADQQEALDELIASQQDPESPEYHQWLTPETFGSRFGVSEMDIDQIVDWLKMHGFEVEPISPARRSIIFSGPAAAVASAFHTQIHSYNVNGARHYANATTPEIPEAFAAVVQGVASLHNFPLHAMHTAIEASGSPIGRPGPGVMAVTIWRPSISPPFMTYRRSMQARTMARANRSPLWDVRISGSQTSRRSGARSACRRRTRPSFSTARIRA